MAKDPLNEQWFRKLITGKPHFIIGGADDPYLIRRYIVPRNRYFNIYLHKFVRSDDDRALHDHPWWWSSLLLKGAYTEHRSDGTQTRRKRGSIVFRRPDVLHRVELEGYKLPRPFDYDHWFKKTQPQDGYEPPGVYAIDLSNYHEWVEKPCWTLFFTGPKIRQWGFKCDPPVGWRQWEDFDVKGCEA